MLRPHSIPNWKFNDRTREKGRAGEVSQHLPIVSVMRSSGCSLSLIEPLLATFSFLIPDRAMSWASLQLSGGLGIVACGRSRNEAMISALIVSLAAIAANDGIP